MPTSVMIVDLNDKAMEENAVTNPNKVSLKLQKSIGRRWRTGSSTLQMGEEM
jgi:hypothetical protein